MKFINGENTVAYAIKPHIEISGTNECIIDGIKGIKTYSQNTICINLGKYNITVSGNNLFINSFSYDGATVRGDIISLEFTENDKDTKMADGIY